MAAFISQGLNALTALLVASLMLMTIGGAGLSTSMALLLALALAAMALLPLLRVRSARRQAHHQSRVRVLETTMQPEVGTSSMLHHAHSPNSKLDLAMPDVPPSPPVRSWIVRGVVIGIVVLGGFGAWATLAPLSSASMAPGSVKVETNRKTVQHLEGGIIEAILVRDGDRVRAGQVLMRLDNVDASADQGALQGQLDSLAAREARLTAQRNDLDVVSFPTDLVARAADPAVATILDGQQRIFDDQARSLAAEVAVLRQRTEQYRAQIASVEAQNESLALQLPSLREELAAASEMLSRGYERRPRVQALEREVTIREGEIAANTARIAALEEQISEAELQMAALRERQARAVSEELREVQTKRAELQEQARKVSARVGRKDIVAPQDGVVVDLRFFTPGGVVAAGAPILDIVPAEDRLVIEARVSPLDIDIVRPGLPAIVRLVAFKQRTTPTLDGRVSRVSADAFTDERTGQVYFSATIEIPPEELARVPSAALYPGMPVDVAIVTGERTLLAYLLQPFTDSFAHAFRED
ncbi:MAG TPA: HlyD family type I secretion periplasmic adaptor subunit [Afifellaceae bacterium]|nr:HlyD family type I secretion periplasmic adaptor subunit [Afifellaceae bacterium]